MGKKKGEDDGRQRKKTALGMIPYGIYVPTAETVDGEIGAAILKMKDLGDNVFYGG